MRHIRKILLFIVLVLFCVSASCHSFDKLALDSCENQVAHYQREGNLDSLILYQSKLISYYQGELATVQDSLRFAEGWDGREHAALLIEWGALGLLLALVISSVVFFFCRKYFIKKEQLALRQMKFSFYAKSLFTQRDLLLLNSEKQSQIVQQHLQSYVDEAERGIEQMRNDLSDEELEKLMVGQAQQQDVVKHFLYLAANDVKPMPDDWKQLHDCLYSLYGRAVMFMDGKRKNMSEEDYRMCLLILSGFLPKHMVKLLCCTPQKISMQRKRYLETFFNVQGKPVDFDRMLRCL